MKFSNRYQTPSTDKPKWELTDDGFLRCKARVLAERVMPYGREELGELPEGFVSPIVNMLVHMDDMSDPGSMRTLEGCPVVAGEHNWLGPEVVRQYTVGSVAGAPRIVGEYLECDLLITDPDTIRAVQEKELDEISAAYGAESNFEPGAHKGSPYDAKQQGIKYNHIAILPEGHGRAGRDVKIFNKNKVIKEVGAMPDELKVQVRLKNSGKTIFTNEAGAEMLANEENMAAENMEVAEGASSKKLEESMSELETKNGEMEALNGEVEELKGELSVYKEKLDALLDGDAVGAAAEEMMADQEEAGEILENMAPYEGDEDGKKKEEVMNSIKGLRGAALHSAVLVALGANIENMSSDAVRGAFKAQSQIMNSGLASKKTVAGAKMTGAHIQVENKQFSARPAHQRLGFPAKS